MSEHAMLFLIMVGVLFMAGCALGNMIGRWFE